MVMQPTLGTPGQQRSLADHPKLSLSPSPPPLPDILRKFNQHLKGYALGTGDATDTKAFFNQAVPGAKAKYASGEGSVGDAPFKVVILPSVCQGDT